MFYARICLTPPCSFAGVYQPSLLSSFPAGRGKVLLLSYFYDRLAPLLPFSASDSTATSTSTTDSKPDAPLTIGTIASLARVVCEGKTTWERHWARGSEAMDQLEDRPEYCLDLTYMHALLKLGYEFQSDRVVEIGKQVLPATVLGAESDPSGAIPPSAGHAGKEVGQNQVMVLGTGAGATELGWCLGAVVGGGMVGGGGEVKCRV